jgi:hypothetical protein
LEKEGLLLINPSNETDGILILEKDDDDAQKKIFDFQSRIFSWRMFSISIFGNPIQQEMRGLVRVKFSH